MTRVTNFGRKRAYLEAGFATEPTTKSNEQLASEVTADGHLKKKRKRTKEPKADGDDEQKAGSNRPGREAGVEGKEKGSSTRQKMAKITKKREGAKGMYLILPRRRLTVSARCGSQRIQDTH